MRPLFNVKNYGCGKECEQEKMVRKKR